MPLLLRGYNVHKPSAYHLMRLMDYAAPWQGQFTITRSTRFVAASAFDIGNSNPFGYRAFLLVNSAQLSICFRVSHRAIKDTVTWDLVGGGLNCGCLMLMVSLLLSRTSDSSVDSCLLSVSAELVIWEVNCICNQGMTVHFWASNGVVTLT
jgi:hypothetical protein